jgi:glycine/D-amino acid oxidase-like deaminating enzyme
MHVAIVGAGFGGLALCWHLSKKNCQVTLFSAQPIGQGGASSIAAGLMHPYMGEQARRSWHAEEALTASKELLELASHRQDSPVADFSGIIRYALDDAQQEHLIKRCQEYPDILRIDENAFLIKSGVTVYPQLYMEGLWKACQERGASFSCLEIEDMSSLKGYDAVVLAAGAGSLRFLEWDRFKLKRIKGQVLKCRMPVGLLKQSLIGKGYVALGEHSDLCYIGATFEREFTDELPHTEAAKLELFSKVKSFFPAVEQLEVLECRAACRLTREGSYMPIAEKIGDKTWFLGAFGSRGLLYHAFFAKQLSEILLNSRP